VKPDKPEIFFAKRSDQRRAMTSPIRLEIIGHFIAPGGMSIAEVAERMGRPPTSLYYHFRLLENVGLLKRVGSRPSGKRSEVLYEPVAERIGIPATRDSKENNREVLQAVAAAFRMAERDMEEALSSGIAKSDGRFRNFLATRFHCRLPKKSLARINSHLRAIDKIAATELRRKSPSSGADQYYSITIALMPLKGRSTK